VQNNRLLAALNKEATSLRLECAQRVEAEQQARAMEAAEFRVALTALGSLVEQLVAAQTVRVDDIAGRLQALTDEVASQRELIEPVVSFGSSRGPEREVLLGRLPKHRQQIIDVDSDSPLLQATSEETLLAHQKALEASFKALDEVEVIARERTVTPAESPASIPTESPSPQLPYHVPTAAPLQALADVLSDLHADPGRMLRTDGQPSVHADETAKLLWSKMQETLKATVQEEMMRELSATFEIFRAELLNDVESALTERAAGLEGIASESLIEGGTGGGGTGAMPRSRGRPGEFMVHTSPSSARQNRPWRSREPPSARGKDEVDRLDGLSPGRDVMPANLDGQLLSSGQWHD